MRVGIGIVVAALSACASTSREARRERASALPVVDIVYPPVGTIFDRACSSFLAKNDVTPELISAAALAKPRLEAEWARHGTRYLATALEEIGAPYPYRDVVAVLTVCAVPTMSTPLIINIRRYLPGADQPLADEDFAETVFHEVIHHYAGPLSANSPLKKRFEAEPLLVLNHLHVIALEKFVLSKLGETQRLQVVQERYLTSRTPGYKRAWEIVTELGPEPFLQELKEAARKK